jgi:hypothetical protein
VAKLFTGISVFIALLCGQPDLLAVACVYLALAIAVAGGIAGLVHAAARASS